MSRAGSWIVLTAGILLVAVPASAKEDWNVDVRIGWDGCYRPLEWTPMEIGIVGQGFDKPFTANVVVRTQQDSLNEMRITAQRVISPEKSITIPLAVRLTWQPRDTLITILDERGLPHWSNDAGVLGGSAPQRLTAVGRDELFVGYVSDAGASLALLERHATCRLFGHRSERRVFAKHRYARQLPWDWTGYACLDVLVLHDLDWTSALQPRQVEAIVEWVRRGGRLVLVLGGKPIPADSPANKLLPAAMGKGQKLLLTREFLVRTGMDAVPAVDVFAWSFAAPPKSRWRLDTIQDEKTCVSALGQVGLGTVLVLPWDPQTIVPNDRRQLTQYWVRCLDALLVDRAVSFTRLRVEIPSFAEEADPTSVYPLGDMGTGSNQVLGHLMSIPELRPLSIWWVVGLLAALAVLVGPVDYFVLKKLDLQPLTWITTAVIVVLFTVGAYIGVQQIRGGAMQVRLVSVTDAVQGEDGAWQTVYAGVFAPESAEYDLAGPNAQAWWAGITPTANDSLPPGLRQESFREVRCRQGDGGNIPTGVPINIWSMQCLLVEQHLETSPVSATLRVWDNRVQLRVKNHLNVPVRAGVLRLGGNRVMTLGPIAANGVETFRGELVPDQSWEETLQAGSTSPIFHEPPADHDMYVKNPEAPQQPTVVIGQSRFQPRAAYFAAGTIGRTRAMQCLLGDRSARGASPADGDTVGVVCLEYEPGPAPVTVKGRSGTYSHVRLVRLVVYSRKDTP